MNGKPTLAERKAPALMRARLLGETDFSLTRYGTYTGKHYSPIKPGDIATIRLPGGRLISVRISEIRRIGKRTSHYRLKYLMSDAE